MPFVMIGEATRAWAHNLDDLRSRWQIRREPPTEAEWMPVIHFERYCNGLDDEALHQLRAGILEIHHQIKNRQSELVARRSTARHLVVVNDMLGRRKHEATSRRQSEFGERFIRAAREKLPADVFTEIIDEAKREMVT